MLEMCYYYFALTQHFCFVLFQRKQTLLFVVIVGTVFLGIALLDNIIRTQSGTQVVKELPNVKQVEVMEHIDQREILTDKGKKPTLQTGNHFPVDEPEAHTYQQSTNHHGTNLGRRLDVLPESASSSNNTTLPHKRLLRNPLVPKQAPTGSHARRNNHIKNEVSASSVTARWFKLDTTSGTEHDTTDGAESNRETVVTHQPSIRSNFRNFSASFDRFASQVSHPLCIIFSRYPSVSFENVLIRDKKFVARSHEIICLFFMKSMATISLLTVSFVQIYILNQPCSIIRMEHEAEV